MARKWHFGARRKNADASSVRSIAGGKTNVVSARLNSFGDGLHLSVRNAAGIRNYRQGIAAEPPVGEDVDRLELHFHERYAAQDRFLRSLAFHKG